MEDACPREKDVPLVPISTDRPVSGKAAVLMAKFGTKLYLNACALKIHSGMADNVSDVQEAKSIKVQAASVPKVCSGTVKAKNAQQWIQVHAEVWRTVYGIEVDATANLDSTKKEDLACAMDLPITVLVIDAI